MACPQFNAPMGNLQGKVRKAPGQGPSLYSRKVGRQKYRSRSYSLAPNSIDFFLMKLLPVTLTLLFLLLWLQ